MEGTSMKPMTATDVAKLQRESDAVRRVQIERVRKRILDPIINECIKMLREEEAAKKGDK